MLKLLAEFRQMMMTRLKAIQSRKDAPEMVGYRGTGRSADDVTDKEDT
jgi:hypothetical protein